MKQLFLVFLGGGMGSLCRFIIGKYLGLYKSGFPWSTLLANLIGCLIIGVLLGWSMKHHTQRSDQYILLAIGFCGGLTTFSSFSLEGLNFLKIGDYSSFFTYLLTSIIGGIAFVGLGHYLFRLGSS